MRRSTVFLGIHVLAVSHVAGLERPSTAVVSRRRAMASIGAVTAAASWQQLFSPRPVLADENAVSPAAPSSPNMTTLDDAYYPFEARNRKGNKGAVIREDYWYMLGRIPPRQLQGPLKGDDPKFNAFGACESTVAGGGNPCTYVSLKQRSPAYAKYSSSIFYGAQEYQNLGRLFQQLQVSQQQQQEPSDAAWQEVSSYVVTEEHTPPPGIIDAELKMILFATAMTTSPNFPGPSRELLVARFYVNEAHHAGKAMQNAIVARDVAACQQAWLFGRDSWNSYFQVVNKSIAVKVGVPFVPIV